MGAMAEVVLDRMLTETEWDALVDPDGGRFGTPTRELADLTRAVRSIRCQSATERMRCWIRRFKGDSFQ